MAEKSSSALTERLAAQAEEARVANTPAHRIMTKKVITIPSGTRIYSAIQILKNHRISGAPVVDNSGRLVGVVTEFDLLMQAALRDMAEPITYTHDVVTVRPETPLKDILVFLLREKHRRLPVVDDQRIVVGVVSRIDVLQKLTHPWPSGKPPRHGGG